MTDLERIKNALLNILEKFREADMYIVSYNKTYIKIMIDNNQDKLKERKIINVYALLKKIIEENKIVGLNLYNEIREKNNIESGYVDKELTNRHELTIDLEDFDHTKLNLLYI